MSPEVAACLGPGAAPNPQSCDMCAGHDGSPNISRAMLIVVVGGAKLLLDPEQGLFPT